MTRKHLPWLLPLALIMATSSCSGGLSCDCIDGGMQPIPGGFPQDSIVHNAVQARLTPHAIDFIESNVDELVTMFMPDGLDFPIDPTTQTIDLVGDVDICHPSGCMAHIELLSVDIIPTPPNILRAVAQVHFWIDGDLPLAIHFGLLCLCWDDCECNVQFDTAREGQPYNTFALNVVFDVDPTSRYTSIQILDAGLTDDIEDGDIRITNNNLCGLAVCNIAEWIKGLLIDQMVAPLMDTLDETLAEFTCRTCGDTGCPTGSTCDGSTPDDFCIWDASEECVPMQLGMEGRMDVGSLLASFSPGAEGMVDLLVNAGDYASVASDGLNLGVLGGLDAVEHNGCVSVAPVPCEGDGDCGAGYTCQAVDVTDMGIFSCRRCGVGCPAGSTPSEKCLPDDPLDTDFNPTALCLDDITGECVRISYCADGSGALQASAPASLGPVPIATGLQVDQFTHCVYCPTGTECSAGFSCSATGVCDDGAGTCETVTDDVMAVAGISETFLRRALYGFVDSGAACLEILPGLVPQLNTALFNLAAAPSLDNVVWGSQPLAMVLKPEVSYYSTTGLELDRLNSPEVSITDDPLLGISLNNVTIDLYAWVEETYSRFETVSMDLTLGVDLEVRDNMITPVIKNPVVTDVRVTNADLLEDDTAMLEVLFGGVIELAMGFLPPMDPIEIPEMEGFVLEVPDGGLGHVSQDGEDFLAIYAQLSLAPPAPPPPPASMVETSVRLLSASVPHVDEERGTAAQFAGCERPEFEVEFAASGAEPSGRPYEYRYRVDSSWWSDWSRNRTARVSRKAFVFQGKHELEVQARLAGDFRTEDPTPARLTLLVDGLEPSVTLERLRNGIVVHATDLVTPEEDLAVSWRVGQGAWASMTHPFVIDTTLLGDSDKDVQIRVVDEAGNTTTGTYSLRGRPPGTDDASSCGSCALTGEGPGVPAAALVLVMLGLLGLRTLAGRRGVSRRDAEGDREEVER